MTANQGKWLGSFAVLAALAWLAYVSADAAIRANRMFFSPAQTPELSASGGPVKTVKQFRLRDLVEAHLFGKKENKTVKPLPVKAPETRLKLVLLGIVSGGTEVARALVLTQGGKLKSYALGDVIEKTDATLYSVGNNSVILERSGRFETLTLQRSDLDDEKNRKRPASRAGSPTAGDNLAIPLPTPGNYPEAGRKTKAVNNDRQRTNQKQSARSGQDTEEPDLEEEEEFLDEEEEFNES